MRPSTFIDQKEIVRTKKESEVFDVYDFNQISNEDDTTKLVLNTFTEKGSSRKKYKLQSLPAQIKYQS